MEINERIRNLLLRDLTSNEKVEYKLINNNCRRKKYIFSDGKKVNEKSIKISNEIYSKGLKLLKKKEKLLEQKIQTDEIELDKIPFKPNLTKRFHRTASCDFFNNIICDNNKSLKINSQNFNLNQISKQNKIIKTKSEKKLYTQESNSNANERIKLKNLSNSQNKNQSSSNLFNKKILNNQGVYERSLKWKENKDKKTRKLRDDTILEENKSFNFSPNLSISQYMNLKTDDRYFKSEIKHIESYIKRRKETLFKEENKKDYEDKIFYRNQSQKNFTKKITYPKEFHFSESKSRKSLISNNKANFLHKPEKVQDLRKRLNTCNFFNESVIEINGNDFDSGKNKETFKSIRDTNYLHIENNRRIINENIKKSKKQKNSNSNLALSSKKSTNKDDININNIDLNTNDKENEDMNLKINLNIMMK